MLPSTMQVLSECNFMKYFISLLLTLSFLTILLFRDIPQLYFFSDDFIWLLNAKQDTVVDLTRYFVDAEGFFYRPVTNLYLRINENG